MENCVPLIRKLVELDGELRKFGDAFTRLRELYERGVRVFSPSGMPVGELRIPLGKRVGCTRRLLMLFYAARGSVDGGCEEGCTVYVDAARISEDAVVFEMRWCCGGCECACEDYRLRLNGATELGDLLTLAYLLEPADLDALRRKLEQLRREAEEAAGELEQLLAALKLLTG